MTIYPDDPNFATGQYSIYFRSFDPKETSIGLKFTTHEVPHIQKLNDKEKTGLNFKLASEPHYFKFEVENYEEEPENRLFLLQIDNRSDIRVYIGNENYPSCESNEHEFALGNPPDNIKANLLKNKYRLELFET